MSTTSDSTRSRAAIRPGLLAEVAFPLLLSALFVFFGVRSAVSAPYWYDEIASLLFLRDPSLPHMLAANRDAINVVPPLYFVLGWTYTQIAGASEMAQRLFSGVFLVLAVWTAWFFLRRRFSRPATIAAMTAVFLSHVLLLRGYEVRYYSLYFLMCVLAVAQYDHLRAQPRVGIGSMIGLFLIQALLCFTHLFGLFVGGCVVLADAVSRWLRERSLRAALEWRVIGPVLLAWGVFALVWGATFRQQAAAFSGHLWIEPPTPVNAVRFFFGNSLTIIAAAFLLLLTNLTIYRARLGRAVAETVGDRLPLLLLCLALLLVPLSVVYVFSKVSTFSGFLFRYMYYILAAWLPLLAFGTELALCPLEARRIGASSGLRKAMAVVAVAFGVGIVGLAAKRAAAGPSFTRPNDVLEARLRAVHAPDDLPVIVTHPHGYQEATYYAAKPTRYYYILDREYAENSGPRAGYNVVPMVIQEAINRHYPDPNALPWDRFADLYDRFLVVDFNTVGSPRWPEYRLKKDLRYRVTPLDTGGSILLVERDRAAQ